MDKVFVFTVSDKNGIPKGIISMAENGYIADLLVDSKYRRQGVAKKLIKVVEKKAREMGIKSLNVTTAYINTPTQKLFEKLGYKKWVKYKKIL